MGTMPDASGRRFEERDGVDVFPALFQTTNLERSDYDQHYLTGNQVHEVSQYHCFEADGTAYLQIRDRLWGKEIIGDWEGDRLFIDLFFHPLFQRLAAIEQLTLPKHFTTMPGTFDFTRWEHLWGSLVFVRKHIRAMEDTGSSLTPHEKTVLQARTLFSDTAQGAFSHMIDWLKQEFGGPEDSHDVDLLTFMKVSGVNETLGRYGIQPEEVAFPDVNGGRGDWVECDSPDLGTDRVDFGAREIALWVDPGSENLWRNCFEVDDLGRLVMKSYDVATYFGVCFGLLATEHWSHPVHRLQLQLFAEMVKAAVMDGTPLLRDQNLHPYDQLYTFDGDLVANMRQIGDLNYDLHSLLLTMARDQRRIFSWGRYKDLESFLIHFKERAYGREAEVGATSFPDPLIGLTWATGYTSHVPQIVEIKKVEAQMTEDVRREIVDFDICDHTLDVFLPHLKVRSVDPLYRDEAGAVRRLSEQSAQYRKLLEGYRALQRQNHVARIYLSPEAAGRLKAKIAAVRAEWDGATKRPRGPESLDALAASLRYIGAMALAHSPNIIRSSL